MKRPPKPKYRYMVYGYKMWSKKNESMWIKEFFITKKEAEKFILSLAINKRRTLNITPVKAVWRSNVIEQRWYMLDVSGWIPTLHSL